jgi:excisionase family DNA binding protein
MTQTPAPESDGNDGAHLPKYLTAEEVAVMLQVSEKSVYRWAKVDASFPALKVGGTLRFPVDRLVPWLLQRTQGVGRGVEAASPPPGFENGRNRHSCT